MKKRPGAAWAIWGQRCLGCLGHQIKFTIQKPKTPRFVFCSGSAATQIVCTQNGSGWSRVASDVAIDHGRERWQGRTSSLVPLSLVPAPSMIISWHFPSCLQSLAYLLDGFSSRNRHQSESEKDATAASNKWCREITASLAVDWPHLLMWKFARQNHFPSCMAASASES